jgi:hypothetical protein
VRRIAVVLGAAVFLSACGSSGSSTSTPSNQSNIPQIQTAIAGTILKFDHVSARVYCPAPVPHVDGLQFACIGVARRPTVQTFVFLVTEHTGTYVTFARTG